MLPGPTLPLPPELELLLAAEAWTHPGDHVLLSAIPFVREPLVLLQGESLMATVLENLYSDDSFTNETFSIFRGGPNKPLPWLDTRQAMTIAANRVPGDDVFIVLDYRSPSAPAVVASDWSGDRFRWHVVAETFAAFATLLGLPLP